MRAMFIDHQAHLLEKFATSMALHRMGPRPDAWVEEVIHHLQEVHPFMAEYGLYGKLSTSIPEKMYAIGYIEVRHPGDHKKTGIYTRIPFVVEAGSLYPLMCFTDSQGKTDLLTRDLFAQSMFQGNIADHITKEPQGSQGLGDMLSPPQSHRFGQGGLSFSSEQFSKGAQVSYEDVDLQLLKHADSDGPWLGDEAEAHLLVHGVTLSYEDRAGLHKRAMAKLAEDPHGVSLLSKIAHTISAQDQTEVLSILAKDPGLSGALTQNGFEGMMKMALTVERTRSTNADATADVVQISGLGNGRFMVKRAQLTNYAPSSNVISSVDLAAQAGEDIVHQVGEDGRITVTSRPAKQENLEDTKVEDITDFGTWRAQELDTGDHILGWAIPNLVSLDMISLPMTLFTNGKQYSLQENIAAVRNDMGGALPRSIPAPHDFGVFYHRSASGRITATYPMTITAIEEDEEGAQSIHITDAWGTRAKLLYAPQLKTITKLNEGRYAIPDTMHWMTLGEELRLVPEAVMFSKMASAGLTPVSIVHTGNSYSLRGVPVEKLATDERNHLDEGTAELMLVGMGLTENEARSKMAEALVFDRVAVAEVPYHMESLALKREKIASIERHMLSHWQEPLEQAGLQVRNLRSLSVKLAAGLPSKASPRSADAVLSLGFINGDNLSLFTENIPHFEGARQDLAELYLAVCLGLPDVPRIDVIRAAEALHKVVDGLKKVKMRAMVV